MKGDFDQPTFSDLRLVLQISQGGRSTSSDLARDGPPTKRQCEGLSQGFYAHKVILAKSPVIKAMLLRAKELRGIQAACSVSRKKGQRKGPVSSPPAHQVPDLQLETLDLPVEQEELLACEVLLRLIYSDDLAEEVTSALSSEQGAGVNRMTLLVQVYRLADRFEVCIEQCEQAISALTSADCDAVNYVFSLKRVAPGLVEHATIKALMEKCMYHLVQRFGVVWKMGEKSSLQDEFKQLDFLAVLAFFDSDDLKVTFSENDVLLLMAVWMDKDSRGSKEQVGAFFNDLRLTHLSTSIISNFDAVVPWLQVDPVVLGRVLALKCHRLQNPGKDLSVPRSLQPVNGSSVAWFKGKRNKFENGIQFHWKLSKRDVAKLLTSVQHLSEHEDVYTVRSENRRGVLNRYSIGKTLSVQLVSDDSRRTIVLSVGIEFATSAAFMSKGIETLALVKAECVLGKGTTYKGSVDDLLHGTHSWEVTRVNILLGSLAWISCLDSYLDEEGNLPFRVYFSKLD
eukprot:gene28531-biopygen32457